MILVEEGKGKVSILQVSLSEDFMLLKTTCC